MTKHPMADLHLRIPAETDERGKQMAADDAGPHKVNYGRWVADLIEAEWKRRASVAPNKPAKKGKVRR